MSLINHWRAYSACLRKGIEMLKNLMMMVMTIVLAVGVSGPAFADAAVPTEDEIATLLQNSDLSDAELAFEIEALVAGSSDPVAAAQLVLSVAQVLAPDKGSVVGTGLAGAASGLTVDQNNSITTAVQSSNVPGVGTTYATANTGGSASGGGGGGGTETGSTDSTGSTGTPPRASNGTGTNAPTAPSNEQTGSPT